MSEQYEFLSPEWLEAVRRIRDEMPQPAGEPPLTMKMNVVVIETPFDGGDMKGHVDTSNGELLVEEGHLEGPDLTVTVEYATAKSIFVDQDLNVAMQAFMAGRIKVQGDITKLMALQAQSITPDPDAIAIAQAVKDLTAS
ncbi:MAG: SCP2 sterol-binding domain-containing protein [Acidimicrobiales bacterium]|nr:SCP2 sterol-binding domain-containing protein [Acidimicrobiales bacterium]